MIEFVARYDSRVQSSVFVIAAAIVPLGHDRSVDLHPRFYNPVAARATGESISALAGFRPAKGGG